MAGIFSLSSELTKLPANASTSPQVQDQSLQIVRSKRRKLLEADHSSDRASC